MTKKFTKYFVCSVWSFINRFHFMPYQQLV